MFRYWLIAFSFFYSPLLTAEASPPVVLVSVAPHKFFVERIAGDTLKVQLMVPAGVSAHTFEPTPKQMIQASQASIWFCLGETFETKALSALKAHRPDLQVVDLRDGVNLLYASSAPDQGVCHCCSPHGADLHIWLSLREAKTQLRRIAAVLASCYPLHAQLYQDNLQTTLEEFEALDAQITAQLSSLKNRVIVVSHPAYAYFCRDYGLKQLAIEQEGREPTARQLTHLLQQVRAASVCHVFIQPQYNNKGALLIAREIGASVIMLNPYAEDYLNSLRTLAEHVGSP